MDPIGRARHAFDVEQEDDNDHFTARACVESDVRRRRST
jgi:hypothetical protein